MPGPPSRFHYRSAVDIRNERLQIVVAETLVECCTLHLKSHLTTREPLWPLQSARSVPSASNSSIYLRSLLPWLQCAVHVCAWGHWETTSLAAHRC
ncbi:hypothetical protein NDU88_001001 [Pleurodeles waltl]|uniref:Uncharacterized protein n=1 Tax=Pleurodeles waltl TaxID=8319 RepID=A0AAV7WH31_PLEWA|nr:hypothetical protein NDU88_001001 [Pleurodeles waltl]